MRNSMSTLVNQFVVVTGTLQVVHRKNGFNDRGQLCLYNVTVAGEAYDHIWVKFMDSELDTSNLYEGEQYTLQAKVYQYNYMNTGKINYGVKNARIRKPRPVIKAH